MGAIVVESSAWVEDNLWYLEVAQTEPIMSSTRSASGLSGDRWSTFAAAMLYPAFQGLTLRWWTSGLRFGAFSMTSRLRIGQVYRVYFRFLWYAFLFTLVAGLCGTPVLLLVGPYLGPQASTLAGILATCALVIGYVMVALGFSTIHQATVKLSLWRLGVDALDLDSVAVLDRVKAQGGPSSPLGEGLADALNVGGI